MNTNLLAGEDAATVPDNAENAHRPAPLSASPHIDVHNLDPSGSADAEPIASDTSTPDSALADEVPHFDDLLIFDDGQRYSDTIEQGHSNVEADELELSKAAEELRAILAAAPSTDPDSFVGPGDDGEPLVVFDKGLLNAALRCLPPVDRYSQAELYFQVASGQTRLLVHDGRRLYWLTLPIASSLPEGETVTFKIRRAAIAILAMAYSTPYALNWDSKQNSLVIKRFTSEAHRTQLTPMRLEIHAPAAEIPLIDLGGAATASGVRFDPIALRRLQKYMIDYIPHREKDDISRGFRLSDGRFFGLRPDVSSARQITIDALKGLNLTLNRGDGGLLTRALTQMRRDEAHYFDFGENQFFSDGVFSFAFPTNVRVVRTLTKAFAMPAVLSIQFSSVELFKAAMFYVFDDPELELAIEACGDSVSLTVEGYYSRLFRSLKVRPGRGVAKLHGGMIAEDPGRNVAEPFKLKVLLSEFLSAMSHAPGDHVTLDFLNGPTKEPIAVRVTSKSDDLIYQAFVGRVYEKKEKKGVRKGRKKPIGGPTVS